MTIDSDNDVKTTAIEAFSRVESSAPAGKPLKGPWNIRASSTRGGGATEADFRNMEKMQGETWELKFRSGNVDTSLEFYMLRILRFSCEGRVKNGNQ